jgi:hypothetical protein
MRDKGEERDKVTRGKDAKGKEKKTSSALSLCAWVPFARRQCGGLQLCAFISQRGRIKEMHRG